MHHRLLSIGWNGEYTWPICLRMRINSNLPLSTLPVPSVAHKDMPRLCANSLHLNSSIYGPYPISNTGELRTQASFLQTKRDIPATADAGVKPHWLMYGIKRLLRTVEEGKRYVLQIQMECTLRTDKECENAFVCGLLLVKLKVFRSFKKTCPHLGNI